MVPSPPPEAFSSFLLDNALPSGLTKLLRFLSPKRQHPHSHRRSKPSSQQKQAPLLSSTRRLFPCPQRIDIKSMIIIILTVCTTLFHTSHSIPIVKAMGCGQPDADSILTIERRAYCCEHFHMNCGLNLQRTMKQSYPHHTTQLIKPHNPPPPPNTVSHSFSSSSSSSSSSSQFTHHPHTLLTKVRTLGQSCKHPSNVRCATGLQCRLGVCMRDKTSHHFRRLVAVGKEVESAERLADEEEEAEEAQKMLKIKGQSVDSVIHKQDVRHSKLAFIAHADKAAIHGDEEDELTANVADFLASRGKGLSDHEWHTVRQLIAGTMDERAEREEEVDQVDSAQEEVTRQEKEEEKEEKEKERQQQRRKINATNNGGGGGGGGGVHNHVASSVDGGNDDHTYSQNQKENDTQVVTLLTQEEELQQMQLRAQQRKQQQQRNEQTTPQPSYSQCAAAAA